MLKKLKQSNRGFTIIEVLIVLAIAALILLIVFLAVPSLQRNSRNTQRKNDAAAISGGVANFLTNNGGTLPQALGKNTDKNTLEICNAGGALIGGGTACTAGAPVETAKLGFYTDATTHVKAFAASDTVTVDTVANEAFAAGTIKISTQSVLILNGAVCKDVSSGTDTPTKNTRSSAIYYAIESGTGNGNLQCIEQ